MTGSMNTVLSIEELFFRSMM